MPCHKNRLGAHNRKGDIEMVTEIQVSAEVIAVFPDKIRISVANIADFSDGGKLKVGSYLRVTDNDDCVLIAIIESFSIEVDDHAQRRHLIDALPLGVIRGGKFERGGDTLTIPPTGVAPATPDDINQIFENSVDPPKKFVFSKLVSNQSVRIPVDGNKFFTQQSVSKSTLTRKIRVVI